MNVWLLTSQFPPTIGGISRYIANTAEMLAEAGHRVTVVSTDAVDSDEETTLPSGARLLRFAPAERFLEAGATERLHDEHPSFPFNLLAHWPALSYQLAERVTAYVERDGVLPDVIECQEYGSLPYYVLQRRLVERHPLSGVPVLVHLHSPDFSIAAANHEPRYRFPAYWVGQMEKWSISAADGVLSPSRFLRDEVAQAVPQVAGTIDCIPYPYLPLPAVEQKPTPGDLVHFGRMELRKGIMALLDTCVQLWSQGHDFRLTVVGGDTYSVPHGRMTSAVLRDRYKRWIEAGRLILPAAPLTPPALWERLAQAWAVLIPSTWENFPNTCIEAMGLGKLVIASTSGGQAEMVGTDGKAGLVFDWAIPGSCAAAITKVLTLDRAQVLAMGAEARRRITALTSFEQVLPQRVTHYEQLIERTKPRRSFPSTNPEITGNVQPRAAEETSGMLSVIVPFYNLGTYVEETLSSILASNYQPREIIILDDGSDEPESLAALERLEAQHSTQLRVVHTANGGLARARNAGATAARGEFIAFVDADDLVEPDYFARAIDVLQRYNNISFVYSWVRFFDGYDGCWPTWNTELPYLLGHNMLTAFAVMRRADFLAFGKNNPDVRYGLEDHDAWISMVERGCVGVSLPAMLVRYRLRPDSMYRGLGYDQSLYLFDLLAERHRETYQRYGAELFGLLNANGSSFAWNHPAAATNEAELRTALAAVQRHVAAIEASRSWKLIGQVQQLRSRLRQITRVQPLAATIRALRRPSGKVE